MDAENFGGAEAANLLAHHSAKRYLRHESRFIYMFSQYVLVKTRCSVTGILGRHAAVALMTGCEALPDNVPRILETVRSGHEA